MSPTEELVAEVHRRVELLQRHAFNASSGLLGDDEPYFLVSREYYSGLFYGPLTNIPFESISRIAEDAVARADGAQSDIVRFFRDKFSSSFERPGPLQILADLLNSLRTPDCAAIGLSFDSEGRLTETRAFNASLEVVHPIPLLVGERLLREDLRDSKLAGVASAIASTRVGPGNGSAPTGCWGFDLVVTADQHVSNHDSIRRPPVQLMQILLRVGIGREGLEAKGSEFSGGIRAALVSSSVAAYSVLYERERYFEKAIRQSTNGTMIKWGDKDAVSVFENQIRALQRTNERYPTHATPHILKYGIQSNSEELQNDARNVDKAARYPWYEMVRYNLPSLDTVLTTTAGLRNFEVRAIARAVFGHLETHFWRLGEVGNPGAMYPDIPMAAIPLLAFVTLRTELSARENNRGSIEKVKKRIDQWKERMPIQVDGKGLTVPNETWNDSRDSLWRAFLYGDAPLYAALFNERDETGNRFQMKDPDPLLQILILQWSRAEEGHRLSVPKFLAVNCHGDPHFENIFIDASIPEDPFIVAIDPITRKYNGNPMGVTVLDQTAAQEMIDGFGRQPMHDVSKLLLSTTGGYALALKGGFVGKLKKDAGNLIFSLNWESRDNVSPLDADTTGMSGAKLYIRSASAAPDAERYQHIFSAEVLSRLDDLINQELTVCNVEDKLDRTICINIYYLQVWAWVVRNTFSIAEKLFPDKEKISDQLLAFGSYILDRGADYLLRTGPDCLRTRDTQEYFTALLSLRDIMGEEHAE